MKPICVKCQRFYRPKKNGIAFVEGMPLERDARPGIEDDHLWAPYKLWSGDLWFCPGCGHELISGVGGQISEHYMPDFLQQVERLGATLKINDC